MSNNAQAIPQSSVILTVNNTTSANLIIASPVGCENGAFLQAPQPIAAGQAAAWVAVGDASGVNGVVGTELFTQAGEPVAVVQFTFQVLPGSPNNATGRSDKGTVTVSQTPIQTTGTQLAVTFTISASA